MTLRDSEPVRIFTSSTASGPPSPRGEGHNAPQIKACLSGRARHFHNRSERSVAGPRVGVPIHERRRGEAHRRQGWVGGVYPSAPYQARTAASDGQPAYPRAARSAGLRFAVRPLSKASDRETTKSGAWVGTSSTANAVPLPLIGEGLITV